MKKYLCGTYYVQYGEYKCYSDTTIFSKILKSKAFNKIQTNITQD